MRRGRRTPRREIRRLAQARIETLWQMALKIQGTDSLRAKRYMVIAKRVAQKARIKVPSHMKRRLCRKCGIVFIPGKNCRVRMRQNRTKHLVVTCLECGDIKRYFVR